ncbi:MAG: TolC family protein [Proteobacteria bacterium]|nr:TolC family protein [Pseudomonadota bacterium]
MRWLSVLVLALPFAAIATPISFDEAQRRALEHAPQLDARRAQIESARQESHRAGALPDPMLTVGLTNLPVTGADAFDTRADEMTMKTVGVRQELPARAKREAQRTLAQRRIDEAQAAVDSTQQAIRRATALAWIDAWAARHELMALQSLREQAALAARLAHARVAAGTQSAADALAADAEALEIDNHIAAAQTAERRAAAELQRWIGTGEFETTMDAPDFTKLPYTQAQLLSQLDRLPALQPIAAQVETAAAQVDAARAERKPDWSVAAAYGQRSGGRSDMVSVEFGIGLPLFTTDRQDRGVAAREADYQAALATREDLRREQAAQVQSDFAQWEGLQRQVALHEEHLLPLAHDRSAAALAAYRAGGALQPWLDAMRDELNAHLGHAEHLAELGRAWAALAFLLPAETQP